MIVVYSLATGKMANNELHDTFEIIHDMMTDINDLFHDYIVGTEKYKVYCSLTKMVSEWIKEELVYCRNNEDVPRDLVNKRMAADTIRDEIKKDLKNEIRRVKSASVAEIHTYEVVLRVLKKELAAVGTQVAYITSEEMWNKIFPDINID